MSNLDYVSAKKLAEKSVSEKYKSDDIVVYDKFSEELPDGWLFIPATKKFVETNDVGDALINAGGFFVTRNGEQIYVPSSVLFNGGAAQYVKDHRH